MFLELSEKPTIIYTDSSLEFAKACEDLSWNHCTSTPHRSETNGIAERAVRRIKEGTSAVLLQSGLNEKSRRDSMECYCYLRNVQDLWSDGKTPYEQRFGEPFKGPAPGNSFWFSGRISSYFCEKTSQDSINLVRKCYLACSSDMHCRAGIWKADILVARHWEVGEFRRVRNACLENSMQWT